MINERAKTKERTNFKNVEKEIPHFSNYSDQVLRPRINRADDLNKLADEIKSTPTAIVNFLIDVGLECFERTLPKLKDEIKKDVSKKIIKLLK